METTMVERVMSFTSGMRGLEQEELFKLPEDWVNQLQMLDLQLAVPSQQDCTLETTDPLLNNINTPPSFDFQDLFPKQQEELQKQKLLQQQFLQRTQPQQFVQPPQQLMQPPQQFMQQTPQQTLQHQQIHQPQQKETQHHAPGPVRIHSVPKPPSPIDVPPVPTSVTLSRDQLLSFTSSDFDLYISNIANVRPLTTAEKKEVYRQKRLIKNRESASNSRKKRKDLIETLEEEVGELEKVNKGLTDQLKELEGDNVILKAEVTQLFNVIRDSPALSKLLLGVVAWMLLSTKSLSSSSPISSSLASVLQQQDNKHLSVPVC